MEQCTFQHRQLFIYCRFCFPSVNNCHIKSRKGLQEHSIIRPSKLSFLLFIWPCGCFPFTTRWLQCSSRCLLFFKTLKNDHLLMIKQLPAVFQILTASFSFLHVLKEDWRLFPFRLEATFSFTLPLLIMSCLLPLRLSQFLFYSISAQVSRSLEAPGIWMVCSMNILESLWDL